MALVVLQTDESTSAGTALVAFFIVMLIVIGVLIYAQNRRRSTLNDEFTAEHRDLNDDSRRQASFEEKMKRIESRLRESAAGGAEPTPPAHDEASPDDPSGRGGHG